jgi:hypothetical protein
MYDTSIVDHDHPLHPFSDIHGHDKVEPLAGIHLLQA